MDGKTVWQHNTLKGVICYLKKKKWRKRDEDEKKTGTMDVSTLLNVHLEGCSAVLHSLKIYTLV